VTSPNRAYLAPCLRHSAQILLRRTSDKLGTLYAIGFGCFFKYIQIRLCEKSLKNSVLGALKTNTSSNILMKKKSDRDSA
jgi:hypothetical protein